MAWTVDDSAEIYGIPHWGAGLFGVNREGHLIIRPRGPDGGELDLHVVSKELVERGIAMPVLVRVPQIAQLRIEMLTGAFAEAGEEYGFQGRYRGVYPVKVNQQRQLVEDILRFGRPHHLGLEAGSKAELLLATALLDDPDALVICNGYKDRRYIDAALLGSRLGRETILVIEKLSELPAIFEAAQHRGIRPNLGVRAKLSHRGNGRWESSAGDRAKFGLSPAGIVDLVAQLRELDRLDCLRMLHFHIGSQVTSIRSFQRALREAVRIYVELVAMGAPMGMLDVGGGLGVDYDGSRTNSASSMNYTIGEYAADVVSYIVEACDEAGVPHPDIVTETGRATVAHCSVLLFDVLGVQSRPSEGPPLTPTEDDPAILHELHEVYESVTVRAYQEAFHDATDARDRARQAFELGMIDLPGLARVEQLFWQTCRRVQHVMQGQSYVPQELHALEPGLADIYYGNLSVFQSIPDSWAVEQLFPCLPVHRLDEAPDRNAIIADLTCDSDGKLDRFVGLRDLKRTVRLHRPRDGEPYVLAVALVGAYQEILGDMHNLFGDTNAVHISLDDSGQYTIDLVIEGDRVEDVAAYVQYERKDLVHRVRRAAERAIRDNRLRTDEAAAIVGFFHDGLEGYTYLGG